MNSRAESPCRIAPADQIWGLVCGMPERQRRRCSLAMLKVYADGSGIGTAPIYVLGGWVAPMGKWADFSTEWDNVLRMSPRIAYFKLSEALSYTGEFNGMSEASRNEKLTILMRVIEDHKLIRVSSAVEAGLFEKLFRTRLPPELQSPYFNLAYELMMSVVAHYWRAKSDEIIDFAFDIENIEEDGFRAAWAHYKSEAPHEVRHLLGNPPYFLDDKLVVALQAADLSAGWLRHQYEAKKSGRPPPRMPWGNRGSEITSIDHIITPDYAETMFEMLIGYRPVRITSNFYYGLPPEGF